MKPTLFLDDPVRIEDNSGTTYEGDQHWRSSVQQAYVLQARFLDHTWHLHKEPRRRGSAYWVLRYARAGQRKTVYIGKDLVLEKLRTTLLLAHDDKTKVAPHTRISRSSIESVVDTPPQTLRSAIDRLLQTAHHNDDLAALQALRNLVDHIWHGKEKSDVAPMD